MKLRFKTIIILAIISILFFGSTNPVSLSQNKLNETSLEVLKDYGFNKDKIYSLKLKSNEKEVNSSVTMIYILLFLLLLLIDYVVYFIKFNTQTLLIDGKEIKVDKELYKPETWVLKYFRYSERNKENKQRLAYQKALDEITIETD